MHHRTSEIDAMPSLSGRGLDKVPVVSVLLDDVNRRAPTPCDWLTGALAAAVNPPAPGFQVRTEARLLWVSPKVSSLSGSGVDEVPMAFYSNVFDTFECRPA